MRAHRWLRIGGAVAVAAAVLAGCAKPAGIDGDLTNNWSPMPEPKSVLPPVGACANTTLGSDADAARITATYLIPAGGCEKSHIAETVFVGRFGPETAAGSTPPLYGSTALQEAYVACGAAASEYLGDDWHNGLVSMLFDPPTAEQWADRRRYYRCDLIQIKSLAETVVTRTVPSG